MKSSRLKLGSLATGLGLLAMASVAQAAVVTKFGQAASGLTALADSTSAPLLARTEWRGLISAGTERTETFERATGSLAGQTFLDPTNKPPLQFKDAANNVTAAEMNPSAPIPSGGDLPPPPTPNPGVVQQAAAGVALSGRFNTTPAVDPGHWWESTGDFTVLFAQDVSAFGFFLTDGADFLGSLSLILRDAEGNAVGQTVSVLANSSGEGDGSLAFFGLADSERGYRSITFDLTQTGSDISNYDVFGFDDMVIGNALRITPPPPPPPDDNGVPEPGSLALALASLGLLAATRRNKGRAAD